MRIDLYLHFDDAANQRLDRIIATLTELKQEAPTMASDLDGITTEVTNAVNVEQSAITLIQGLAAQIESLKNDPAALQSLADNLKASDAALAAAVQANTPPPPPQ